MNFQSKCPTTMVESMFTKQIKIPKERIEQSWQRLQKRETFVKSQFFRIKLNLIMKVKKVFSLQVN